MPGIRNVFIVMCWLLVGCNDNDSVPGNFSLLSAFVGSQQLSLGAVTGDVAIDQSVALNFSKGIDRSTIGAISLMQGTTPVVADISFSSEDKMVILFPKALLQSNSTYVINITSALKAVDGSGFDAVSIQFKTITSKLSIVSFSIGGRDALSVSGILDEVPLSSEIVIAFASPVDPLTTTSTTISLKQDGTSIPTTTVVSNNQITILPSVPLKHLRRFQLNISQGLKGVNGEPFDGVQREYYTTVNTVPMLPLLPHDEDSDADNTNDLLSVVQQQTFKYFWDFGHPVSGMARERNTSGDVVTSGGTGFGIMALIVGMERQFISRDDGLARMEKIVTFLEKADRFHGAWSHWIDGSTGKVVPFSAKDNGGDLVETSFLVQGLITFRQYLNAAIPAEANLRDRITSLWEGVEWDWYRKQNEEVLYWHWSPDFNWEMNFPLYGYFEEQITYLLAASSPSHGIPLTVYSNGYGLNGSIVRNQSYYGYKLPLGSPSPLFWVHYSYLGLDPHFSDAYANYWEQNVTATRINYAYCLENPKDYVGYGENCWGLTSSDNQGGYDAHSPSNDKGVITPTAAISSLPYTPEESMKALKFFYYTMGDRLWGEYGFYDAFNLTSQWTATSYLAIDQGPIIVMIENYRTGLLWDLFMSAPEVQQGSNNLNFVY
ncbi:glucoamylase family protein [Chryseolinea sp. T2]|uniref:glucoamylase family protein n=1 Tax=Chryseolinea sp. T2 TaxID=3129255 RepID=UPI0030780834